MVRTRSAARASQEATAKFDRDTKGKVTLEDPYILDPVGLPPGFTKADRLDPARRIVGPPLGFSRGDLHCDWDEDDKERMKKLFRMDKVGTSSRGAKN